MTIFIANHEVEDFDEWKAVHDEAAEAGIHDRFGVEILHIVQSSDDPNDVSLVGRGSAEDVRAFLESDALEEAMSEAGVIPPLEVFVGPDRQ